jgi:hypothetical protein
MQTPPRSATGWRCREPVQLSLVGWSLALWWRAGCSWVHPATWNSWCCRTVQGQREGGPKHAVQWYPEPWRRHRVFGPRPRWLWSFWACPHFPPCGSRLCNIPVGPPLWPRLSILLSRNSLQSLPSSAAAVQHFLEYVLVWYLYIIIT